MFIRNGLAEKLINTFREDEKDVFRRDLGFNAVDAFHSKQQAITKKNKRSI